MPNELDRQFDEELGRGHRPGRAAGHRLRRARSSDRHQLPNHLPEFFRAFCALNADNEAVVAGDERLSFADLDRISDRVARGLIARGNLKGDRVGIAMRNCPSWVLIYMAVLKTGAIATLLNGWWEAAEMEHAILLTDPKLIIADAPRAARIAARCAGGDVCLADRASGRGGAGRASPPRRTTVRCRDRARGPCHDPLHFGLDRHAKGALSTHRAVTTGTYAYAIGLIVLLGILTEEEARPPTPARTLVGVPLFHVTGEVPVMLNSFVIGRCMVLMPKWVRRGAAADREGANHLFRGGADDEPRAHEPSRSARI